MNERHVTDQQRVLADLARQGADNRKATSITVGAALATEAQVVKIAGLVGGNVYSVQPVILGEMGTSPTEIGAPTEAFNLAESFQDEGTLAAGTYALMVHVVDKNVFYAAP